MENKFKTMSGDLTQYAFTCGYVQTRLDKIFNLEIKISHNGNNYDVKGWDMHNSYRRVFWFSTDSIVIARKIYKAKRWRVAWTKLSEAEKYISSLTDYETGYNSNIN